MPAKKKPRVLSGIQPSGSLHIGNYFGMMKPMLAYQERAELFIFLVNYHALTSVFDGPRLAQDTLEMAADWLALGLDPDKTVFWVQSDVKEVVELTWILSTVASMGLLERCHSYKDKIAQGLTPNHALFAYPVLMAADILAYNAEIIPVGQDQKQHVEVTRDIGQRFNHIYGQTFVLPESQIGEETAAVPGLDGQKMSKSYDNTIEIFADEPTLRQKVMKIVTDSTPVDEPKNPDRCNLFALFRLFAGKDEVEDLRRRYLAPGLRYGDVKIELFERIRDFFAPFAAERNRLLKDPGHVRDVLRQGAEKARSVCSPVMDEVRRKVGLLY
ncbi:MAG: tryptophan--tRNA ligase [Deltaproteobacteria bacterium]|nr:tryptophan--tRNA ligase [Deltaproteobacteria bacterium]